MKSLVAIIVFILLVLAGVFIYIKSKPIAVFETDQRPGAEVFPPATSSSTSTTSISTSTATSTATSTNN